MEAPEFNFNLTCKLLMSCISSSPRLLIISQTFFWVFLFRNNFPDIFNPFGHLLSVVLLCSSEFLRWPCILFGLVQTILDEPGGIFKWFLIGPNEKGQTSPTFHIGLAPFWAIFEVAAYFKLVDRNHGWKLFVLQNLYLLLHFARQSRTDTSLITVRDLSVRYDTYLKCIKNAKRAEWWFMQLYHEDRANYYFGKVKEAVFLLARKKTAPYSFDTIF